MSLFEIYYKDKWEFKNINLNLSSIDNALCDANFSQNNLGKIIHIAGTNGKGSTAFFLAQILKKHGVKTALFTSPHILDIKERLKINLENISSKDFDEYFTKYKEIINKYNLSYFESIFLISVMWFSHNNVDVTILETGLGGTYDATNTSLITDKTCVFTSISQDHTDYLGKNIYSIINDKFGIIRKKSKIFLSINKPFIIDYIKKNISDEIELISLLEFAKDNYIFPYSENYSTAKGVAEYILGREIDNLKNLLLPPCRLEKIGDIILDGSHNASGLLSLKKSNIIKDNPVIIFTSTKDRNLNNTYNILSKISSNLILTSIPNNNRSIIDDDTKNIPCKYISDNRKALNEALKINSKNILITGSFYLSASIKQILLEGKDNE